MTTLTVKQVQAEMEQFLEDLWDQFVFEDCSIEEATVRSLTQTTHPSILWECERDPLEPTVLNLTAHIPVQPQGEINLTIEAI